MTRAPQTANAFKEYPEGISQIRTILGSPVRVLPNDVPGVKYFGYLIGKGKGLEANGTYILEVVYPEDAPRATILINRGNETNRGFHTGNTVGDAMKPRYIYPSSESLEIPLSGKYEAVRMMMRLQDRFTETGGKRGAEIPDPAKAKRTMTPADGFWVYIAQYEPEQDPLSKGSAIAAIRLYKAPPFESYALHINFPPDGLPRRNLFFREEMADGVVGSNPDNQGFDDPIEYYAGKAELMRFLGMNTFAKDLLEFGANQGWDSSKFGGNRWVFQSKYPERWERIVKMVRTYDLSVLPYFEYSGSLGREGLGQQKRAEPLEGEDYTHIAWTEKGRADLTDPDTFEDFRKMLEITVVDLKDQANFLGAWLRPRSSQLPIGFSDATRQRFSEETGRGSVSREELKKEGELYDAYIAWWCAKRKNFLVQIRDYLRDAGVEDARVLYTADSSEAGRVHPADPRRGYVAENPAVWKGVDMKKDPVPLQEAIKDRWSYRAQTTPQDTWGKWEWQHAAPAQDPENYKETEGVLPTYTFNRLMTVSDPAALEAFTTPTGLAMIRHYSLNENMLRVEAGKDGKDLDPLGYFVADMERVGPYIMLPEANAMAKGNPTEIGYLASNNFNRLSPAYVRRFNAAFLSLPALPSKVIEGAASDPGIVVRRIDGGSHGVWYVVVNPGYERVGNVTLRLPDNGTVTDATTGEELATPGSPLTLDLDACQLIALRVR